MRTNTILTIILLLCSLVFAGEETPGEYEGQEASQAFPHLVKFGDLYYTREYHLPEGKYNHDGMPHSITEMNRRYVRFKESKNSPSFSEGKLLCFQDGAFYCDGERITLNTFNIFEELRYAVDEHFGLNVTNEGNHACILGGQYVLLAGIVKFNEYGQIAYLDNATGHICSNPHQLQQVARHFWSKGMLDPNCIIGFWDGGDNSLASFLVKELPFLEGAVRYPSSDVIPKEAFEFVHLDSERERSLAVKILEIWRHREHIVHLEFHAIPTSYDAMEREKLQKELGDYNVNIPHDDLYGNIVSIYDHYTREKWMRKDIEGRGCHIFSREEKDKFAIQLDELKRKRPNEILWAQIFGTRFD
jgi:hypothetical protein